MIKKLTTTWRRMRGYVREPEGGALLVALLTLAALLLLWWQAGRWYQAQLLAERRSEAAVELSLRSSTLSSAILRRFVRLQGLVAFAQTDYTEQEMATRFGIFAAGLYAGSQGIRHLAIAPGGVVRYVYPLTGNERILGYEALQDPRPDVRADAQRAVESQHIVLSGPIELTQGGMSLVAQQAVYRDGTYWGLVSVVVDLPALLEEARLNEPSGELVFALRDSRRQVFYGSSTVFDRAPVTRRVDLPEGDWELAGVPQTSWYATVEEPQRVFQIVGLVIVGLLTNLVYLSVNRQTRLAQLVRQRTEQLRQDIARREQAEIALREREEQYRSIFESTSDSLLVHDLEGHLVDFNPAAARMHGYSPEAFRHLQPPQFIHPDSLPCFVEYVELVRAGEFLQRQVIGLRKDGTAFPVKMLGAGFTFRGRPHILVVARDITEEVHAHELLEQRVRQRTRELSTLLDLSSQLASTLELSPSLDLILDQIKQMVDYTSASLLTYEENELRVAAHRGPVSPGLLAWLCFSLKDQKAYEAMMLQSEPLVIDDVQGESPLAQNYRQIMGTHPEAVADAIRTWMGVPLMVRERLVGVLSLDHDQPYAYTAQHVALALVVANQAAIAIENTQLYEQAQRLAVLEERQRLARELHDSVSQVLYGIGLSARTARTLLDRDPAQVVEPLDYVLALAEAGLAEMRALILELRPDFLKKEGLVTALNRQAVALRARLEIDVRAKFCEEPHLPLEAKEVLYRIAQEALNNIVKHAQAGWVDMRLSECEQEVILVVQDDGVGFDHRREYPGHLGLHSMRERADSVGGTLEIESQAGEGTLLQVRIPHSAP
ncbi:MAG: PAS domain S-box protein [Thermoflexales bacterium]|nr:PAS domain S-box protein [Thermoflexales bacterium]